MRALLTSPVREYRAPGSARGLSGNRRSYLNGANIMRYLTLLSLIVFALVAPSIAALDATNTIIMHPGDVLYAKFDEAAQGLRLLAVAKDKDDQAQLILTMEPFDRKTGMLMLEVKSRFKRTMTYKAEMRWPSKQRRKETSVVPVMAGLISIETWPHPIEELALYSFALKN